MAKTLNYGLSFISTGISQCASNRMHSIEFYLWHVTDGEHEDYDGHDSKRALFLVASRNGLVHGDAGRDQDDDRHEDHHNGRPHQTVVLDVHGIAS